MKHPLGMYVISVTEMWERFSFYIFNSILVLFMLQVLHFSSSFSTFLFGIIIGFTYLFQLLAGYISDTFIGNRKAIIIGGILMIIAQLIFAYDASLYYLTTNVAEHSSFIFSYIEIIFLVGVGIMAIGASFIKVSVTSFIGLFYPDNEELVDSAYTVFYMLINVGGFLGPLAVNFIVGVNNPSLYQYGFLLGAITMFIGLVIFIAFKNKYLRLPNGEPIGATPISKMQKVKDKKVNVNVSEKLSKIEIDHLKVIIVLLVIITVFFIAHEQISSSLVILALSNVNNIVPFTNFEVAPQIYMTLNPLFIILLSPVFIKITAMLSNRNKEPSSISKIGIGLLIVGFSYVVLLMAVSTLDANMQMNMVWIILFNLFLVIGEILVMPVALSLTSKLAPPKYTSLMMGIFFAATAVAVIISGIFASAFPDKGATMLLGLIPITNLGSFMWIFIILCFGFGIVWLLIRNPIKKLMHGIN